MATYIHPTAFVDPDAELAEDVQVGAYCIIQGKVRLAAGNRLLSHVIIHGPAEIGPDNKFYPFSTTGFAAQDRGYDAAVPGAGVRIGSHNIIREGVSIHRATGESPTSLGDHNYLMANAHVGHDCAVGNHCTLANSAALAGHVELADRVTLGGNAAVHQFCRVGELAMISGVAAIVKDLPPFCVCYTTRWVSSLNLVGLRRAGLREHIGPLSRAYEILSRGRHTNEIAADHIADELGEDPLCTKIVEFIRGSQRGISAFADRDADEE